MRHRLNRHLVRGLAQKPAANDATVLQAADERPRRKILAPLLAAVAGLVLAIVVTLGALIYWPRHNRDAQAGAQGRAQTSQASISYVYLRQPVYYRTTHPPGTILVDKAQRFAYVVLPNVVALRYGIGVGPECATAQGLYRISRKEEWPGRAGDSGLGKIRNLFAGNRDDNPLGARALYLQEYRLHGTNAPSSIGNTMPIGCVALPQRQHHRVLRQGAAGNPRRVSGIGRRWFVCTGLSPVMPALVAGIHALAAK